MKNQLIQPFKVNILEVFEAVVPVLHRLYQLLHESCTQSAGQVVEEEALLSHRLLHDAAEHPDGKHVEEEMRPVGVHEHICEELPRAEVARQEEVQAEQLIEIYAVGGKGKAGEEAQHIDDEQVFSDGWYRVHRESPKCVILRCKGTKNWRRKGEK